MTKNKLFAKIGFYLLSMLFFVVIVLILGTDIPIHFGSDYEFIGWKEVFTRKGTLVPIICFFLLILTAFFVYWLHHKKSGSRLGPITISEIENVNSEVMSFVASYFIPLVSFNISTTWRHIAVLFGLFILIGFIYIKANIYFCNPTLSVLGYHVYRIKGLTTDKRSIKMTIITNRRLTTNDTFMYIPIDPTTSFAY